MSVPARFKYRAFLSYSHKDTGWAKWLHRWLEGYSLGRDLVGRATSMGPVPKTLRPIFRDREEFAGGHGLTVATIAAIDVSAALIVLCSPASAKSQYVNEEVRLFKSRHPERPVIPVIVEGTPPANFPAALRFELEPGGTVSSRPVTILAPDLRDEGDGKSLALAKVIAGLTGVGTDEIVRRAERDKLRRLRHWVAGLFTVVFAIAGLTVWAEINRRDAVEQRKDAQRSESYFRAEQATRAVKEGDVVTGLVLALDGLPDEGASEFAQRSRPYALEAETALFTALVSPITQFGGAAIRAIDGRAGGVTTVVPSSRSQVA